MVICLTLLDDFLFTLATGFVASIPKSLLCPHNAPHPDGAFDRSCASLNEGG